MDDGKWADFCRSARSIAVIPFETAELNIDGLAGDRERVMSTQRPLTKGGLRAVHSAYQRVRQRTRRGRVTAGSARALRPIEKHFAELNNQIDLRRLRLRRSNA